MRIIQGFIIWFIITLFVTYAFCLNTAAAVFSDVIKHSLQASDTGVSVAMGAFIAGFACMQIPAGYLLDKYNPRWVVSCGIFLLALGNLLISFSNNIVLFSISNLIQGVGGAFAFVAAGVLIALWFTPNAFPILFGLTQTFSCISVGIVHYIFSYLLQKMSWNELYQYLALCGLALLIAALIFVTRPSNYVSYANSVSLKSSLKKVFSNSQIWLCTLAAATSFGILMAYAGFWYLKVQNFYAVKLTDSLIISGLIFAGIGVGTPILGWLSNILKSRIMVIHTALVLGNMMLLIGIYAPHFNVQTYVMMYVVSFLIGFFLSAAELFYTVISEISTNSTRGVALSMANTGIFLINTVMLFVPYYFITAQSSMFFTYLWILPLVIMISILLVYFIKESFQST